MAELGSIETCLSGKKLLIRDATLPRLLLSVPTIFNGAASTGSGSVTLRSGLVLELPLCRLGVRACFNLPTGEGDLRSDPFVGRERVSSASDGVDVEAARLSACFGKVALRGVRSKCSSNVEGSGRVVDCINGEEVVR